MSLIDLIILWVLFRGGVALIVLVAFGVLCPLIRYGKRIEQDAINDAIYRMRNTPPEPEPISNKLEGRIFKG